MMNRVISYVTQHSKVAILMGISDTISQNFIEKKEWDLWRTGRFASVGLFYVSPVLTKWFGFLDRVVPPHPNLFKRGMKKMFLDQTIFAPTFNASLLCIFGILNRYDLQTFKTRLVSDYITVMKLNYCFWPLFQSFNFALVPIKHQPVSAQTAAIIWNIILSRIVGKEDS